LSCDEFHELKIQIINDITKLTGIKTGKCYQIKICVNNCRKNEGGIEFLDRLTADAMASAGINCCSTVCQHKCM
jgi:hypothetical protein